MAFLELEANAVELPGLRPTESAAMRAADRFFHEALQLPLGQPEREQLLDDALCLLGSSDPNHASVLNLRGRIALEREQYAPAQQLFLQALDNRHPRAALHLGYTALAQNEFTLAQYWFGEAGKQPDVAPEARFSADYCRLMQGDVVNAFLGFCELLADGHCVDAVKPLLGQCASALRVSHYQPRLDSALTLLVQHQLLPAEATELVSSLLRHKYVSGITLEQAQQDPLLRDALHTLFLGDHESEHLLRSLRQQLADHLLQQAELSDPLQDLCLGLIKQAVHSQYAWPLSESESRLLQPLLQQLDQLSARVSDLDTLCGLLIGCALFVPLYDQPFAHRLLKRDLQQWPHGLWEILDSILYTPTFSRAIARHMTHNDGFSPESVFEATLHPLRPILPSSSTTLLERARGELLNLPLPAALGQPEGYLLLLEPTLNSTLTLAQHHSRLEVIALSQEGPYSALINQRRDQQRLTNLQAVTLPLTQVGGDRDCFSVIDAGDQICRFNEQPAQLLQYLAQALKPGGILRLELPLSGDHSGWLTLHELAQAEGALTNPGALRQLREAVREEADHSTEEPWYSLRRQEDFGSLYRFYRQVANPCRWQFALQEIPQLIDEAGLQFFAFGCLPASENQRYWQRTQYRAGAQRLLYWMHRFHEQPALLGSSVILYLSKG